MDAKICTGRYELPLLYEDKELGIFKVPHMGPVDNNGYILFCQETREGVIIDAPAEPEKLLGELGDIKLKAIIITHRHADHTASLDVMKTRTGAPIAAHPDDAPALPLKPDMLLNDGDTIQVGKLTLRAMHTPGHTPGGVCLNIGKHLFSGDTLFQGGPGRTNTPENFIQVKGSIARKLLPLSDDTVVYTGHGPDTRIGDARQEIKVFDSKSHPADLCGDVEWLKS